MVKPEDDKDRDFELQQDILEGRKFSLAELIGREGGDFLKGESPVPKITQLKAEVNLFVNNNLHDLSGELQAVLNNWVNADDQKISSYQDNPLMALSLIIEEITGNENLYYEFVRQVDLKSGQMNGERPYFQRPGQPAHPEDEYTHESVRTKLVQLLEVINRQ